MVIHVLVGILIELLLNILSEPLSGVELGPVIFPGHFEPPNIINPGVNIRLSGCPGKRSLSNIHTAFTK